MQQQDLYILRDALALVANPVSLTGLTLPTFPYNEKIAFRAFFLDPNPFGNYAVKRYQSATVSAKIRARRYLRATYNQMVRFSVHLTNTSPTLDITTGDIAGGEILSDITGAMVADALTTAGLTQMVVGYGSVDTGIVLEFDSALTPTIAVNVKSSFPNQVATVTTAGSRTFISFDFAAFSSISSPAEITPTTTAPTITQIQAGNNTTGLHEIKHITFPDDAPISGTFALTTEYGTTAAIPYSRRTNDVSAGFASLGQVVSTLITGTWISDKKIAVQWTDTLPHTLLNVVTDDLAWAWGWSFELTPNAQLLSELMDTILDIFAKTAEDGSNTADALSLVVTVAASGAGPNPVLDVPIKFFRH